MTLSEQLHMLLPQTGRYCMFLGTSKQNHFYDTVDELVEVIQSRPDEPKVYMALASFGELDKRTQANANELTTLFLDIDCGAKKHAEKPEATYPSQMDGIAALAAFCKASGLKPSLIVSSGEGLHVYFRLTQSVPANQAQPVMERLKALCKHLGLKADPAVTSDTARVLRPIGSLHSMRGDGTENRVTALKQTQAAYTLEDLDAKIKALLPEDLAPPPEVAEMLSINRDVLTYPQRSASIQKVAEHCAAIAEVRDSQGVVPEPHWRGFIGVAKHCDTDGETVIHKWSEGYNGYDARETEIKFANWKTGPATCEYFADQCSACATCQYRGKITSPIQVGYVDVQPKPAPQEEPPAPSMALPDDEPEEPEEKDLGVVSLDALRTQRPELFRQPEKEGFFFGEFNGAWRMYHRKLTEVEDATGDTVKQLANVVVANRLFWLESCTRGVADDDLGTQLELVVVDSPVDLRQRRYHIPASCLADKATTARKLLERNIILDSVPHAAESLRRYMSAEHSRIQHKMKHTIRTHFGYDWQGDEMICAYGDLVQRKDFSIERSIVNPRLDYARGQLRVGCLPESNSGSWNGQVYATHVVPAAKRYAAFVRKFYGQPGFDSYRLALALGLASSYLVFSDGGSFVPGGAVPASGLVVSLFSNGTGRGKTALQTLIAGAFGAGAKVMGGDKNGATQVARSTLASGLSVFPVLLDEVSQNESDRQTSEIQQLTNGSARVRGGKDGAITGTTPDWNSIAVVSTNRPQAELVINAGKNTSALLARLFELNFDHAPDTTPMLTEYRSEVGPILHEGGAIGMLLTAAAVRRGRDSMVLDGAAQVARIMDKFALPVSLRFYVNAMAAVLLMNRVLVKAGVEMFDEEELLQTFYRICTGAMDNLSESDRSPEANFAQLLSDLAPHIVVTNSYPKRGAGSKPEILMNSGNLRLPVLGRQINDQKELRLSCAAFSKWCAVNQLGVQSLLDGLRAANILVSNGPDNWKAKVNLSAGVVSLPEQARVFAYTFRLGGAALSVVGDPGMVEIEEAMAS